VSLLDKANENIIIYPEEVVTDVDGNTQTRASKTGIPAVARIQPVGQSGTSARRAEQDNEGFETEQFYRLRLPRKYTCHMGAQAQVDWRGKRFVVHGDAILFTNSPATSHSLYMLRRF
jgi:uncharacterized protein YtpQ (UPF0354 family)